MTASRQVIRASERAALKALVSSQRKQPRSKVSIQPRMIQTSEYRAIQVGWIVIDRAARRHRDRVTAPRLNKVGRALARYTHVLTSLVTEKNLGGMRHGA